MPDSVRSMASQKTNQGPASPAVLSPRALNRATLSRQLLFRRTAMAAKDAVGHLVGLQAQNTKPPYYQLAARLDGFDPEELSGLMASREVARIVTLRSTIHTHTADDCLTLRLLVQGARDRELGLFRKGLTGVDLERLARTARAFVEESPRTPKEIRELLLKEWPEAEPLALGVAARCLLPLVQVTPRGLWGQSGQVALTTAEQWFGRAAEPVPAPDATVLRYLAAFGPASVKDMQTWCGLTRLREAFERLRPRLVTFQDVRGVELFDLPDAPRPDEDTPAPPRFLPEFDNLLLSHADRTRVVPAEYKERTWKGNQSHRTFLVDGFLAGIWRLEESDRESTATLTAQPFGPLGREQRAALVAEGEYVLATTTRATTRDVRFGTVSA